MVILKSYEGKLVVEESRHTFDHPLAFLQQVLADTPGVDSLRQFPGL
jgi:hypothetical protein